jgi:hypothetical protein
VQSRIRKCADCPRFWGRRPANLGSASGASGLLRRKREQTPATEKTDTRAPRVAKLLRLYVIATYVSTGLRPNSRRIRSAARPFDRRHSGCRLTGETARRGKRQGASTVPRGKYFRAAKRFERQEEKLALGKYLRDGPSVMAHPKGQVKPLDRHPGVPIGVQFTACAVRSKRVLKIRCRPARSLS